MQTIAARGVGCRHGGWYRDPRGCPGDRSTERGLTHELANWGGLAGWKSELAPLLRDEIERGKLSSRSEVVRRIRELRIDGTLGYCPIDASTLDRVITTRPAGTKAPGPSDAVGAKCDQENDGNRNAEEKHDDRAHDYTSVCLVTTRTRDAKNSHLTLLSR